ncbi:MAG: hypothetical protein MR374_01660 [Clostridia bacterium]|nr:hypothetical protein [Clostridia bacterium]
MKILASVYQRILDSMPAVPPEIGGILGSIDGVICECQVDAGCPIHCGCFYSPNVDFLNDTIKNWQSKGIVFHGIFHTHFFGVQTLSDGDMAYINVILQAMPTHISELYFPVVVLPEKIVVSYLAIHDGKMVNIKNDELSIV